MNASLKNAVTLLAAACALAVAGGASAQSAGQFTAKIGAGKITPKVDSGDVSAPALPGSKVDVGADTQPLFIFAYGLTDNISAELALGVPYKHKLYGAGAIAGTGQIGTVEALPPSAFIQYRMFRPEAMLRPFVGVGVTYAYFQKETGSGQLTALLNTGGPATTFEIKSKVAPSLQAGLAFNINPKWFVDVCVVKTFLEIDTKFSTGQTQQIKLDPLAVVVAVGYKF
ncbi:OmpW/AlkL family protein [Massilia eurypsychrophila]|jgi:outer membrane protein|uniref:OmpW/AlkL family protein n=1 Tax=Massilia eurypsychrophila TaxID=1485217 RepID=UPI0015D4A7D4|nr:OmpW family outer membrane protein [Massilia eurypsychrophila]